MLPKLGEKMGFVWLCIPEAVGCQKGIQLRLKGKTGQCGLLATIASKRSWGWVGGSVSRDQYFAWDPCNMEEDRTETGAQGSPFSLSLFKYPLSLTGLLRFPQVHRGQGQAH